MWVPGRWARRHRRSLRGRDMCRSTLNISNEYIVGVQSRPQRRYEGEPGQEQQANFLARWSWHRIRSGMSTTAGGGAGGANGSRSWEWPTGHAAADDDDDDADRFGHKNPTHLRQRLLHMLANYLANLANLTSSNNKNNYGNNSSNENSRQNRPRF
uniref:HDC05186 n=1 Tax=Drosophila melanogaster TaxID=7227 RepID=Q6IGU4_DROME|nr:TPA_inf: HDC05186 [Drosophila melanogaster]